MNKLLKIGIPVLVAVLLVILGAGIVAAQSKDILTPAKSIAYEQSKPCPQFCQGDCNGNGNCPAGGNCNGTCQSSTDGSCCLGNGGSNQSSSIQRGSCCGLDNNASATEYIQRPARGCCR